jgi:hypothetical protein
MVCAQWTHSLLMSYILNAVNSGVYRILPTRLSNLPPESGVLRKCLTNPVQCLHVVYRSRKNCLFKHTVRRRHHQEVWHRGRVTRPAHTTSEADCRTLIRVKHRINACTFSVISSTTHGPPSLSVSVVLHPKMCTTRQYRSTAATGLI